MRINLRINFGKIKQLSTASTNYSSSLKSLHTALEKFVGVVDSNKGLAADELKDKPADISNQINKLASGLEVLAKVLNEFDSTMTGIISPVSDGSDMYIETFSAKNAIKNLSEHLEGNAILSKSYNVPTFSTSDLGSEATPEDIANGAANKAEAEQIIRKMESITEHYAQVMSSLSGNYAEDLKKIHDKIEKFENTDDEFENKGESLYEGWLDLKWCQTTGAKILFAAAGVAICIGIIVGAPLIAAGAAAVGLSAGAATAVTTIAVGAAKGALIAAAATGGIDTTMAIINQKDIDSAASTGLCEGLITGSITGGVAAAAPYIVQAGGAALSKTASVASKYAPQTSAKVASYGSKAVKSVTNVTSKVAPKTTKKVLEHGDEVAIGAIEFAGDIVADKTAADALGKDFNLAKSVAGATADQYIDGVKDKVLDKLNIETENMGFTDAMRRNLDVVYKGGTNIISDEAKNVSKTFINNAIDVVQTGEGSIFEPGYEAKMDDPSKAIESALKGNKVDGKNLFKRSAKGILDHIENGLQNRVASD